MDTVDTIACPSCGAINKAPADRLRAGAKPKCGRCGSQLFSGHPHDVADADDLDRIVAGTSLPIVIDLWAPWCGPCRMMAPHFQGAAVRMEPRARFLKIDTERLPDLAARFGVRSIPTLVLLQGGREVARRSGVVDAREIDRWVTAEITGGHGRVA